MNGVSNDRALAHAHAIRARGLAMPPEGLPNTVILDSWARCMDRGQAPSAALTVPVVPAHELHQRRERAEFVRRLAQAELETLSRQIAGSNFLLAFADSEGVILDLYADNRFSMSSADAGILSGSCWSEAVAGTNGLGTALVTGQSVAVTGPEHFYLQLGGLSCTATPVHDATGQVVGVLDASSYYESRQRHTQALVQMAAVHIENGLLAHQTRGQLVLALHPRPEFLGTLSAGLLAFDGDGRLAACNGPAHGLLAGLDITRGTRFEELFGEPLDHVMARLHRHPDVRLRDALGSVLVARLVGRPSSPTTARTPPAGRPARALPPRDNPVFLADDPAVAQACRLVQAAGRMGAPMLLQGETGTGKELLARHAHETSGRGGEFVAVNCAALPADLFEAELFGYAAGAFTGARREGSPGLIVAADGGTLLLDELNELPLPQQAALLRFLDDQTVRPVGGRQARRVNVLMLAASNADLDTLVQAQRFRADLLYRLNTVRITLPPLRCRSDFAAAVRWVLQGLDAQACISDAAVQRLARHSWPGNFRELRSVLTRLLLAGGDGTQQPLLDLDGVTSLLPALPTSSGTTSALQRTADEAVRTAFEHNGHSISRTSRALGISRTTVYRHLRQAGVIPG